MAARKIKMARVIRVEKDDGAFDLEFWRVQGDAARFEAAWEAICDLVRWGKIDEHELRLQRSVVRAFRRSSPVSHRRRLRRHALRRAEVH
jgi:hypothetical protein